MTIAITDLLPSNFNQFSFKISEFSNKISKSKEISRLSYWNNQQVALFMKLTESLSSRFEFEFCHQQLLQHKVALLDQNEIVSSVFGFFDLNLIVLIQSFLEFGTG